VPWLEPDVVDHLDALAAAGVPAVVIAPVGFVSDHVEVIWDLDTEARERADELGIAFARAATAGPDPRFADMVVELVAEHVHRAAPRALSPDVPSAGCTVNGLPCAVDCCVPARRPARPDVSDRTVTAAVAPD
jgi:ferrochelatase